MLEKAAFYLRPGINPLGKGAPAREKAVSLRLAAAFGVGHVPLYLINREITLLLEEGVPRNTVDSSLIELYTLDFSSIGQNGRRGIEEALLLSTDPDTFGRFADFWCDNYNTERNSQWEGFHRATFILAMLFQKHAQRIPEEEAEVFVQEVCAPFNSNEDFCPGSWFSGIDYEEEQNEVIAMLIQFGLARPSIQEWLANFLSQAYVSRKDRYLRGTIRSFCLSGSDSRRDRIMRLNLLNKEEQITAFDLIFQAFTRAHPVRFQADIIDPEFAIIARGLAGTSSK